MILAHLPALQIVVPLMAAPVCVVFRSAALAWGIALIVTWGAFAGAMTLLLEVLSSGPISYAMGNWAAPWGIAYRIDLLSAFVLVTVAGIGALTTIFARASVAREVAGDRVYLFYGIYLLCFTGLMGIPITGDAFNLFVFLEIASLSSYVLISLGHDRRALTAAFRYLIMGTLGATFYIIGVGLMYMMTGTLNMADLAARIPGMLDVRTIQVALAFLTVGVALKLAMMPLHLWLPNAYTYAPTVVTIFLAATATKVAVYMMIRIIYTIFGGEAVFSALPIGELLLPFAMMSMVVGSTVAIFQTNAKRLLAFSSIAQIGYMLVGVSLADRNGLTGGILHLLNHALMKATLFMAIGCVLFRAGSADLKAIAGFGRRMPVTGVCVVVGGLGLIGTPLTVGFVSKWILLTGALDRGMWPVAAVIVLSSVLAGVYVWRLISVAFVKKPQDAAGQFHEAPYGEAPIGMLVPLCVLGGLCIALGVDGSITGDIAARAAQSLMPALP